LSGERYLRSDVGRREQMGRGCVEQMQVTETERAGDSRVDVDAVDAFYVAVGSKKLEPGGNAPVLKQLIKIKIYEHKGKRF